MSPSINPCRATGVVQGVQVSCDKRDYPAHRRHHDPTWDVWWGGDRPAPRTTPGSPKTCDTEGCNLLPDHAGPHGEQLAI